MGHRMAADFKSLAVEITKLFWRQIARRSQKSGRYIKGSVKAEFAKHWNGGDQVGLAAVVEGHADARFGGVMNRLADVQATKSRLTQELHLAAKGLERQDVADITRFGLAELTASQLQFVVHQKNDVRGPMTHDETPSPSRPQLGRSAPVAWAWRSSRASNGERRKGPPARRPEISGFF